MCACARGILIPISNNTSIRIFIPPVVSSNNIMVYGEKRVIQNRLDDYRAS